MASDPEAVRILVVEDDFLIRLSTVEMLQEAGYAVVEASSAEAALSQVESGSFTILLTDMGLPRMSGADLARAVRKRQPGIAVIFATGQASVPLLDSEPPPVLLQKPFEIDLLMDAINRAIEQDRPA